MPERLTYTVPEIAELLGISRSSVYQCVHRGEIPPLVLGRRVVVARAALEALLTNFVDASGAGPSEGPDDRAD